MCQLEKIKNFNKFIDKKSLEFSFYHQFLWLLINLLRTGPGLLPDLLITKVNIQTPRHFSPPTPPTLGLRLA